MIRYIVAAAALLCLAAPAARAAEAETHILDEALSLTGDCSTGKLDLIPDPGCPGGTHPSEPFANPSSVATDPHGDVYVASAGPVAEGGGFDPRGAHIDVFDPSGNFLTELAVPGAQEIAVDAGGHLYVTVECGAYWACYGSSGRAVKFLRFDPSEYDPEAGTIEYGNAAVELPIARETYGAGSAPGGIAIDPRNQHVFASYNYSQIRIEEFAAPVDGEPNEILGGEIGAGVLHRAASIALDAEHGLLYAVDQPAGGGEGFVRVFELAAPHQLVRTITGSVTPAGSFKSAYWLLSIAAEEATGHIFISDISAASRVYELEEDGTYLETYQHGFNTLLSYIHLDNSSESPNQGYLFVPSGASVPGHAFAFKPKPQPHSPTIEGISVAGVGEREAVLRATINPEGFATHYRFEYTTEAAFADHGFEGAATAGEGDLAPAISGRQVSAPAVGLAPGTAYRFRVRATSECEAGGCGAEEESSFATFSPPLQGGACENSALRSGPSAALPDCRAYELVTPPDTNGQAPQLLGVGGGIVGLGSPTVRADGGAVPLVFKGGALPGLNAAGSANGDLYLATRTASGWQTASDGPTGEQDPDPAPIALSPDFDYAAYGLGSYGLGFNSQYLRYPDGSFHLIGEGSPESDPGVTLKFLGPEASHVVFSSQQELLPGVDGGLFDRTADGVLHLIGSPGFGSTLFSGSSADGSSIAIAVGAERSLAVRLDDSRTVPAGPAGAKFAGFTEEGRYLFYVSEGNFFRFDTESEETVEIVASADAEPVNVPRRGGGAYFISVAALGEGPNPQGAEPVAGQPNLYYWDGAATRFVATVTGEEAEGGNEGFRAWMNGVAIGALGLDPTRSSLQGSTLLFRSRARITPYDSEGHSEVYRYDAGENTLACVSCNPTGAPAASDAKLVTFLGTQLGLDRFNQTANLSDDGARAFFDTSDRLVPADNDGTQDVYEWEAEGKGSCRQAGGCLFLISSGQSALPNYFIGAGADGDDAMISTSDLLTRADGDETASIYDARVEGGFPAAAAGAGECLGEACQPAAKAPERVTPASSNFQGAGNLNQPTQHTRTCPKGKRLRRLHGKRRCVKKHKRHRSHGRHGHKPKNHRQGRSGR